MFNLARGDSVNVRSMIDILAEAMQAVPIINYLPTPPSELTRTWGSIVSAAKAFNFSPQVSIHNGIARFVDWYRSYVPPNSVIPATTFLTDLSAADIVKRKRAAIQAQWLGAIHNAI